MMSAVWAPTSAGAATAGTYVALGDSYAAAPLVPSQILAMGECWQSNSNFAHILQPVIGTTRFADASCSGAKTTHMTQSQSFTLTTNPPQFNRLTSDTAVVTLEIGGNDIGFSGIIQDCATANPFGSPCKNKFVQNGVDEISNRINTTAPKVAAVIDGIKARSPQARVLVLGYPAILPDSGIGCWPAMPIAWNDVSYLRSKHKQLNSMIATQAAARGATYVDVYTPSIGKDSCASSSTRWVEPIIPSNSAAPVHPNARGERGMATAIRAKLGV
jgi:lysophospholipase L1-like esterase